MSDSGSPGSGHVLVADVERIQDHVFETGRLRQIRGASYLIENGLSEAINQVLPEAANAEIITCGGGIAQIFIPGEGGQVEQIMDRIALEYRQRVPGSELRLGRAPVEADDLYSVAVQEAIADGRLRQALSAPRPHVGGGLIQPCAVSGRGAAVGEVHFGSGEKLAVSAATLARQEATRQNRQKDSSADDGDDPGEPLTIEDLAGTSPVGGRYVGLVVADGNAVGELLANAKTKEAQRELSERLRKSLDYALERASAPFPNEVLPVISAGDDLLCLVHPARVLEFTNRLLVAFEESGEKGEGEKGLTMAAGVVIAHHKFPFARMRTLAEGLNHNAKLLSRKRARDQKKERGPSTVDFMVVSEATAVAPVRPLLARLGAVGKTPQLLRDLRPYEREDFESLLGAAGSLGDFSRNQLKSVLSDLLWERGGGVGAVGRVEDLERTWKLLIDRVGRLESREGKLPEDLRPNGLQPAGLPDATNTTALPDAVEIMDWVEAESGLPAAAEDREAA